MVDSTNELRTCSRCKFTFKLTDFGCNSKGESYNTCNTCRNKTRETQGICNRCSCTYTRSQGGLKRHMQLWKCVKTICPSQNNKEEFFNWAVEHRKSLPMGMDIWAAEGEKYFMKKNDRASETY